MQLNKTSNMYRDCQRFADLTKTFIIQGNIRRARKCLAIAEDIFLKGNREIKNIISNVYVFSVSSFMEMHHCNIKQLFPDTLKAEYKQQTAAFGS